MDTTTIESIAKKCPHLVHANNICVKLNAKDLSASQRNALCVIVPAYLRYITANLNLKGFTSDVVRQRVAMLNEYYTTFFPYNTTFSSQGKLRSTILEEFIYLLFKDLVCFYKHKFEDTDDVLKLGSVKAFTNIYLTTNGFKGFLHDVEVAVNQKDQDFAIYRPLHMEINGKSFSINMPALAIEVKTYLDKTMYEGAVATAEKIKSGNPYTLFFVVTETYDVSFDVDPAYSRLDQIFVLRKSKRVKVGTPPPIDEQVTIKIMEMARTHFERSWSSIEEKMKSSGTLI